MLSDLTSISQLYVAASKKVNFSRNSKSSYVGRLGSFKMFKEFFLKKKFCKASVNFIHARRVQLSQIYCCNWCALLFNSLGSLLRDILLFVSNEHRVEQYDYLRMLLANNLLNSSRTLVEDHPWHYQWNSFSFLGYTISSTQHLWFNFFHTELKPFWIFSYNRIFRANTLKSEALISISSEVLKDT